MAPPLPPSFLLKKMLPDAASVVPVVVPSVLPAAAASFLRNSSGFIKPMPDLGGMLKGAVVIYAAAVVGLVVTVLMECKLVSNSTNEDGTPAKWYEVWKVPEKTRIESLAVITVAPAVFVGLGMFSVVPLFGRINNLRGFITFLVCVATYGGYRAGYCRSKK